MNNLLTGLKATEKLRVLALANYKADKDNRKTYATNDRWLKDNAWRNSLIESKLEEAYNELYN